MSRRLSEKFRLRLVTDSARFLSLALLALSLSTFRLCKSFLFKTLAFLMDNGDDFFSSPAEDTFLDLDFDRRSAPSTSNYTAPDSSLYLNADDNDIDDDKLFLVPYRWWREAQNVAKETGTLYDVSVTNNDEEISLELRKVNNTSNIDSATQWLACQEFALVPWTMWLQALKWHSDHHAVPQEDHSSLFMEDDRDDVFPLKIRLSVSWETKSLIVKMRSKENTVSSYCRACDIFNTKAELMHIWDFSGQTTQFLVNDNVSMTNGSLEHSSAEILLELLIHGFSDSRKHSDDGIDKIADPNTKNSSFSVGSVRMNGSSDYTSSCSSLASSSHSSCSYTKVGPLGLTGLQNLGNTCFMNSAIQCLAHTPKLVDYFLGDYKREINRENPLGMKGELAFAFGELLRKLWIPGAAPVAPVIFKQKLEKFASQFSGYNQHDSQEFLAFLLDGLHEDLNRVKHKVYREAPDAEGHPDMEVADEYWRNHLARNNSIIVDLCQGQYRSTLVCPICGKKSVTFDPFMYLSLPLPATTMRTMTLTIISSDGVMLPSPVTVTVPKCGRLKDLIDALSSQCGLTDDETLLVAEVYKNKIFRFLDDQSDALALIRDDDQLVAYRLPKDNESSPLFVFMHEALDKPSEIEGAEPNWKLFGIPLVTRSSDISNGLDLYSQYLKLLSPFVLPADDAIDYDESENKANEEPGEEDIPSLAFSDNSASSDGEVEDDPDFNSDFRFYIEGLHRTREIKMKDPVRVPMYASKMEVYVAWSEKMVEKYDTCILSSLPEVFKPQLYTKRPQESVSLYKCLEAYLKEEPLGPDDMWYCPGCQKHRQACKKLDLWRLPEILIVHLKRFSYSRYMKNKLETYVDFPVEDFDLSNYLPVKNGKLSDTYELYAVSNHYGGMGGGHYTAFVHHGHGRWYEFDDDRVYPISEQRIKTAAAYVLFFRRVK